MPLRTGPYPAAPFPTVPCQSTPAPPDLTRSHPTGTHPTGPCQSHTCQTKTQRTTADRPAPHPTNLTEPTRPHRTHTRPARPHRALPHITRPDPNPPHHDQPRPHLPNQNTPGLTKRTQPRRITPDLNPHLPHQIPPGRTTPSPKAPTRPHPPMPDRTCHTAPHRSLPGRPLPHRTKPYPACLTKSAVPDRTRTHQATPDQDLRLILLSKLLLIQNGIDDRDHLRHLSEKSIPRPPRLERAPGLRQHLSTKLWIFERISHWHIVVDRLGVPNHHVHVGRADGFRADDLYSVDDCARLLPPVEIASLPIVPLEALVERRILCLGFLYH